MTREKARVVLTRLLARLKIAPHFSAPSCDDDELHRTIIVFVCENRSNPPSPTTLNTPKIGGFRTIANCFSAAHVSQMTLPVATCGANPLRRDSFSPALEENLIPRN